MLATMEEGKMKFSSWLMALLGALMVWAAPAAEVFSSNTHAMVKVETVTTNVLIAMPWVFYTPNGDASTNLPVDHLVWPKGLDDGDLLMQMVKAADGAVTAGQGAVDYTYATWTLVKDVPADPDSAGHWETTKTVAYGGDTKSAVDKPLPRGIGLWVVRKNPKDSDGNWKPIYLYGQYTMGAASVTVAGSASETNSVMVAHPLCKQLDVNTDIDWEGVGEKDTLEIPNGTDVWGLCQWDGEKWYTSKLTRVGRVVKSVPNYDITVPAGQGFWYVRRAAGEMTITFKETLPSEEAASAE